MNFEKSKYDKMLKLANTLFLIVIIICSITAFLYILIIALQNVITNFKAVFVVPVMPILTFLLSAGSIVFFSFLLIKKDVNNNKSIVLELTALIVTLFISTIFSTVLLTVFNKTLGNYEVNYIQKYSLLSQYLSYARAFMPYALTLFTIGTTVKMIISILDPVDNRIE